MYPKTHHAFGGQAVSIGNRKRFLFNVIFKGIKAEARLIHSPSAKFLFRLDWRQ